MPPSRWVGGICAALLACAAAASAHAQPPAIHTPHPTLFADVLTAFVPYANDVPVMMGGGVQVALRHEIFAHVGLFPTGDDRGYGVAEIGYRYATRPGKWLRPLFGGRIAAVPATCGHDDVGRPQCVAQGLFIFAASVGLRVEPQPWIAVSSSLSIGVDSYPNPFGMVDVGLTFPLPPP